MFTRYTTLRQLLAATSPASLTPVSLDPTIFTPDFAALGDLRETLPIVAIDEPEAN